MIGNRDDAARPHDDQALIEAVTRPSQASLVDALFSLPEDAETARAALDNGLQSALARKMRSVLRRRPPEAA